MLALAYGTSYLVGAAISATLLSRRLGGLAGRRLLNFVRPSDGRGRPVGAGSPGSSCTGSNKPAWNLEQDRLAGPLAGRWARRPRRLPRRGPVAADLRDRADGRPGHLPRQAPLIPPGRDGPASERPGSDVAERASAYDRRSRTGYAYDGGTSTNCDGQAGGPWERTWLSLARCWPTGMSSRTYWPKRARPNPGGPATASWHGRSCSSCCPAFSPYAADLVAAAKRASRVTDTRILQVLDAIDDGELSVRRARVGHRAVPRHRAVRRPAGSPARDLADARGRGRGRQRPPGRAPASPTRSGQRGRDQVEWRQADRSRHRRGAARRARPDDDPELEDTFDLGRLLYACLTARWPGGDNPDPASRSRRPSTADCCGRVRCAPACRGRWTRSATGSSDSSPGTAPDHDRGRGHRDSERDPGRRRRQHGVNLSVTSTPSLDPTGSSRLRLCSCVRARIRPTGEQPSYNTCTASRRRRSRRTLGWTVIGVADRWRRPAGLPRRPVRDQRSPTSSDDPEPRTRPRTTCRPPHPHRSASPTSIRQARRARREPGTGAAGDRRRPDDRVEDPALRQRPAARSAQGRCRSDRRPREVRDGQLGQPGRCSATAPTSSCAPHPRTPRRPRATRPTTSTWSRLRAAPVRRSSSRSTIRSRPATC